MLRILSRLAVAFACVAVTVVATGCAGKRDEIYPTLSGRFAAEADVEPLIAEQCLRDPDGFRIVFRQGAIYEGGGPLARSLPGDDVDGLVGDYVVYRGTLRGPEEIVRPEAGPG